MPAPRQGIHVEERRIGKLHQKDAVAWNVGDRIEIGLAREDMERIEHEPDRRMFGAPHHLPGIAVVGDMAAPGERLEADAHAMACGQVAERMKVGRRTVDAAEALRRDVGTHQQQIAAELVHERELALRTGETARAALRRHSLEIAERLEGDDLKAEVGYPPAHIRGRPVERQEIVFEDLHAPESGCRDGFQLLGETTAERDGRDRQLHGCFTPSGTDDKVVIA